MVALWLELPEVPVIVTVVVPVVAVASAENVSVEVLLAGFALNAAVTPLGNPDAESVTLPSNPFAGVIVIVLAASAPCTALNLPGAAESV
jgi:hypothetical protein